MVSPRPFAGAVLGGVLLIAPLAVTVDRTLHPHRREDLRTVIDGVSRDHAGDIYVYARAIPAWTYDTLGPALSSKSTDPIYEAERSDFQLIRRAAASPGTPCFENTSPAVLDSPNHALGYASAVDPGRRILLGLAGGAENQGQTQPSPGWADHEARRMKEAAPSGIWLVATHGVGKELEALQEALAREGGHVQRSISAEGAWARLYAFQ
jgi:hypothetical protein